MLAFFMIVVFLIQLLSNVESKNLLQKTQIYSELSHYQISSQNVQIQINEFKQLNLRQGVLYTCYVNIFQEENINMNFYSSDAVFGMVYDLVQINGNAKGAQNRNLFISQSIQKFKDKISQKRDVFFKMQKNLEYKHFVNIPSIQRNNVDQDGNLLIFALYVPSKHQGPGIKQFSYNLSAIVTTNNIKMKRDSFQKTIQFKLKKEQTYNFTVNSKLIMSEVDQSFCLFHLLHIVGDFHYNVSLHYLKKQSSLQAKDKNTLIQQNRTQSTFILNKTIIMQKHQQLKLSTSQMIDQTDFQESQILFEVKCVSIICNLIAQFQSNSQIRKVVPGIPYIYWINQMQIFQLYNPFDLQVFIDMNKKNGFPQYQICSTRMKQFKNNQCINQLKNPSSPVKQFQVKEKDDKFRALGRNSEIIINPDHQAYCFQCTYFVALYTQYDNLVGMITFKNSITSTIIPEGNSVTKVLKRNLTDEYFIWGTNSRLLFQKFSGKNEAFFEIKDLKNMYNLQPYKETQLKKIIVGQQSRVFEQNYYSIDLKQYIELNLRQFQQMDLSQSVLKLYLQTQNNYPSTYYSLMIVNDQSRKIMLKDGVPFFNRQKNKISVFKYETENLQTQSFGTIIINSNQIQQIQLQIYGYCVSIDQQPMFSSQFGQLQKSQSLSSIKKKLLDSKLKQKNYSLQKIQNKKINLMANRIDIIIQADMCKSYIIKTINKNASQNVQWEKNDQFENQQNPFTVITYQILVSFVDSMILPLNNEVPGILQYPGKIMQIYEVFVSQKSNISILINFCRSAKSRMEIYRNKQSLVSQNSDQKIIFSSDSQVQQIVYMAHSGIFYLTIEFFGFSSILQYTILIKYHQIEQGFYYIDLSKQQQEISYLVKDGRFFSTTYELYFSPIFLKHWSKDIQRDVEQFETKYFILESNSYPLLQRASNCKGQFFSDIVNHHEHFKQLKLQKQKLVFHPPQKQSSADYPNAEVYQRGFYSTEYETSNPLSFLIIVPVIVRQKKGQNGQKQFNVIPYWKFDKKSRQPYRIIQLYNGKLYSVFEHWLISSVIWAEEILDFHMIEGFLVKLILMCSCLPVTCCLMICVYKTKVNIQYYGNKLYTFFEQICRKNEENIEEIRQVSNSETVRDHSMALPTDQVQIFSEQNIETQNQEQGNLQQQRLEQTQRGNMNGNFREIDQQEQQQGNSKSDEVGQEELMQSSTQIS